MIDITPAIDAVNRAARVTQYNTNPPSRETADAAIAWLARASNIVTDFILPGVTWSNDDEIIFYWSYLSVYINHNEAPGFASACRDADKMLTADGSCRTDEQILDMWKTYAVPHNR